MNRTLIALVVVGAVAGCTTSPSATPSPSPTATPVGSCQVSVTPDTIVVDPDSGQSDDVLFFAGTGFPPGVAVTIHMAGSVMDATTTGAGGFTLEVGPDSEISHPRQPGPATWTITAWDAPQPPRDGSSLPPKACEAVVEVTIRLTSKPSQPPPTDLSAGDFAEVIADGVRVRAAPSPTATIVGALFPGDVVRILEPAQVAEGYAWYRIETVVIQSGQPLRGYVAAGSGTQAYLQRTGEPLPPTPTPSPSPSPSPT